MKDLQINIKGAKEYLSAARVLTDHASHLHGPIIQCQGQAIEIALKLFWPAEDWSKKGSKGHKLRCLYRRAPSKLTLSEKEQEDLALLDRNYRKAGAFSYPCRYRPSGGRVYNALTQERVELLFDSIISQYENSATAPYKPGIEGVSASFCIPPKQ